MTRTMLFPWSPPYYNVPAVPQMFTQTCQEKSIDISRTSESTRDEGQGQGARDDWIDVQDTLVGGSSTFAFFDLFRALPEYETHSNETCRTNFLVTVSYNQVRSSQCEASRDGDLVVQEYRGSAIWCSPMKANISFADTSKKTIPCGIRHRGNLVSKGDNVIVGQDSIALRSGSIACMKCSVEALEPSNHLVVSLKAAKFEVSQEILEVNYFEAQ